MSKQETVNGHHTNGNGTVTSSKETSLKKSDFIIAPDGRIVFEEVIIRDKIPAGEYYPIRHKDQAFLSPIRRNAVYEDGELSDELMDDDLLVDLAAVLDGVPQEEVDRYYDNKAKKSSFVPVHAYFPIEQWSPGIKAANDNVERFLRSRDLYRRLRMDYRRSILLYGDPGTGKSQYLYHLSQQLIKSHNAIVVRIESHGHLDSFKDGIQHSLARRPDRLKVIIIEELAEFSRGRYNTEVLNVLDSMHFRENVLFLITTNYPDRIPENVVDRPSRLDLLSGVYTRDYGPDFVEAWYEFIMGKPLDEKEKQTDWFLETPGRLSPAYLKELFMYSQLLEVDIDTAWSNIKGRKETIKEEFRQTNDRGIGFNLEESFT